MKKKTRAVGRKLGSNEKHFAFIKDFNKESQIPNDQLLLKYEFYIIHIINYDFYVFCPYKAIGLFINCRKIKLFQINLN